jgi:hypothetical protein
MTYKINRSLRAEPNLSATLCLANRKGITMQWPVYDFQTIFKKDQIMRGSHLNTKLNTWKF